MIHNFLPRTFVNESNDTYQKTLKSGMGYHFGFPQLLGLDAKTTYNAGYKTQHSTDIAPHRLNRPRGRFSKEETQNLNYI